MYHSDACWKSAIVAQNKFDELGSDIAKREAVNDQMRIWVNVLGWKDIYHA